MRAQLSTLFKDTDRVASLVQVARSLAILPELLVDIDQWLQHTSVIAEPRARSRIFSLLALVGSERAHELLVQHGVASHDPAVVRDAVLGASHARVASARLLDALAAVAYGICCHLLVNGFPANVVLVLISNLFISFCVSRCFSSCLYGRDTHFLPVISVLSHVPYCA